MPANSLANSGFTKALGLLLLALFCAVESPDAFAQEKISPEQTGQTEEAPDFAEQAFSVTVARWNRQLDSIEAYVNQQSLEPEKSSQAQETLSRIRQNANEAKSTAEARIGDLNQQLEALGPKPSEGEQPESNDIRKRRNQLNDELSFYRSRSTLADLALARIRALEDGLSQSERTQLLQRLLTRGPIPFLPETIGTATRDLGTLLTAIKGTATAWWESLPETERTWRLLVNGLLFLAGGFAIAWIVRRVLIRRFGAHPTEEAPAYSQRLLSAVADGLAKGIIPAALLGVILIRTNADSAVIHSEFGNVVGIASAMIIIYILATALPHAVLAPEYPEWRLTRIPPESARRLLVLVRAIAFLFCVDEFLVEVTQRVDSLDGMLTPALTSVWSAVFNTLQALCVLALLKPGLWQLEESETGQDSAESDAPKSEPASSSRASQMSAYDEEDEDDGDEEEPTGLEGAAEAARAGAGAGFWRLLRIGLALAALIGLCAPFPGYTGLGNYLMNNLLGTGLVVGILYILRGLFREVIGLAFASAFIRETMGVEYRTRSRMKFWLRLLMDILVLTAGILAIAPGWGVSKGELLRWVQGALQGFTIGNVTISVADIALGLFAFFIVLMLTSTAKRMLSERVLPQTNMDEGVQHSVTAGLGYVGFVVAAALAIAVMGVDLSNIAIIAGALSVGIGFGLQNIVNNFVSGLILLIERPIKVGDWVVVGQNEGFVKQINMRATEIETWQRASVIVPNADLLSSSLVNWTHKDKYGRIDIPVGVALDTDPKKVERIFMRIARKHPRIVRWPQPMVLLQGFGSNRLLFELRVFTDDIMWIMPIASELRFEINRRFREEGVIIPYEQRVVHISEGDPQRLQQGGEGKPVTPPRFAQETHARDMDASPRGDAPDAPDGAEPGR